MATHTGHNYQTAQQMTYFIWVFFFRISNAVRQSNYYFTMIFIANMISVSIFFFFFIMVDAVKAAMIAILSPTKFDFNWQFSLFSRLNDCETEDINFRIERRQRNFGWMRQLLAYCCTKLNPIIRPNPIMTFASNGIFVSSHRWKCSCENRSWREWPKTYAFRVIMYNSSNQLSDSLLFGDITFASPQRYMKRNKVIICNANNGEYEYEHAAWVCVWHSTTSVCVSSIWCPLNGLSLFTVKGSCQSQSQTPINYHCFSFVIIIVFRASYKCHKFDYDIRKIPAKVCFCWVWVIVVRIQITQFENRKKITNTKGNRKGLLQTCSSSLTLEDISQWNTTTIAISFASKRVVWCWHIILHTSVRP